MRFLIVFMLVLCPSLRIVAFLCKESELKRRIIIFLIVPALFLSLTLLWLSFDWLGLAGKFSKKKIPKKFSIFWKLGWERYQKKLKAWVYKTRFQEKSKDTRLKFRRRRSKSADSMSYFRPRNQPVLLRSRKLSGHWDRNGCCYHSSNPCSKQFSLLISGPTGLLIISCVRWVLTNTPFLVRWG